MYEMYVNFVQSCCKCLQILFEIHVKRLGYQLEMLSLHLYIVALLFNYTMKCIWILFKISLEIN